MYFIIFNPVSGNTNAEEAEKTIKTFFDENKLRYTFHKTAKSDNVENLVKKEIKKGANVIVAAGGDGTISAVVNGMYKTKAVLGILPTGSANTFAKELQIPLDTAEACKILLKPENIYMSDVILIKDRPYIIDVSVGINALTMRDTKRKHKRLIGVFAYFIVAIKWLIGFQPRKFTIIADGVKYMYRGSEVLIANGGVLRNLLSKVIPHTQPNDGYIDIIIVRARGMSDYLKIIWYLILNKRTSDARVKKLQAKHEVIVRSHKKLPIQADGEIIGKTPLEVKFAPQSLPVVVPA